VASIRTLVFKSTNSALKSALFFLGLLVLLSCSHTTRSLFFDIPPPKPEAKVVTESELASELQQSATQSAGYLSHPHDLETDRPPIEDTLDWAEALALLPQNKKGEPDWSAALREDIVKPRALDPADRAGDFFKLDFVIPAEKSKFNAYFPHSSHVVWMGCDSCHPSVFQFRENDITMKAIRKGEYCGACHGSVAFSAKDCKRCHTEM